MIPLSSQIDRNKQISCNMMAYIKKLRTATYFVLKFYFTFGLSNERVRKKPGNAGLVNMSSKGDYSLSSLASVTLIEHKRTVLLWGSSLECFKCLFSPISKCVNLRKLMF